MNTMKYESYIGYDAGKISGALLSADDYLSVILLWGGTFDPHTVRPYPYTDY